MTLARTPYARLSPADIGQVDRELKKLERMSAGLYVPKVLVAARSPYTVQGTDTMLLCDCTAGPVTLSFPLAARVEGMNVVVVKSDTSTNAVTLSGTFSGVVNPTITVPDSGFTVVAMNRAYHVTAIVTYPKMAGEAGVTQLLYRWGDFRRYGGIGNGIADDSTAVHAALTAAMTFGWKAYAPSGFTWRVTSGFQQSTDYKDVVIEGDTSSREDHGQGSIILLDSTDPASYFYDLNGRHLLTVRNATFKCAQYVLDREFFKFSSASSTHLFENVNFESVEKPIVYERTCYFQNAALRNVQFRNSGTIHSKAIGTDLLCTLLELDNVNHEGSVPINSEAVVCNLSGLRMIQGTNFLLEGALSADSWTVLKLADPFDASWTRYPFFSVRGYHSEWTGAHLPAFAVDQSGGLARFDDPSAWLLTTTLYKLSNQAIVSIRGTSFTGAPDDPASYFSFGDRGCMALVRDSTLRKISALANNRMVYEYCALQTDGTAGADYMGATLIGNAQSDVLWKWDGGNADGDLMAFQGFAGSTITPSTDATFGRKLLLTPSASALSTQFTLKSRGVLKQYDQVAIILTLKLPAFTSGSILVQPIINGVGVATAAAYTTADSGSVISLVIPLRLLDTPINSIGLVLSSSATVGLVNPIEIYGMAIYQGNGAPRQAFPNYPKQIMTRAAAVPTVGTWAVGDYVKNTTPVVGSPKGWYCTVAGTPGTWVSEGNL